MDIHLHVLYARYNNTTQCQYPYCQCYPNSSLTMVHLIVIHCLLTLWKVLICWFFRSIEEHILLIEETPLDESQESYDEMSVEMEAWNKGLREGRINGPCARRLCSACVMGSTNHDPHCDFYADRNVPRGHAKEHLPHMQRR